MELILLTAVIIFLAIYLWLHRTDSRLPPFPKRPLPLVGNLFHLSENPRPQFKKWRKQCGDIFSLNMVGTLVVVLNGIDVIKEALVKKADAFSDRPYVFYSEASGLPGKGITFTSGNNWKEQRKVCLAILRRLGMGKNIMADKIQEEVSAYVNYLAGMKGQPTDIRIITNISTANVICSIIIGHRFDYDDKEFQTLIAHLNLVIEDQGNVSLLNYISWLKYLPGDLFKAKKNTRTILTIMSLVNKFITLKKCNDVDSNNVNNFIEAYIVERNKKIEAGESTELDDDNLLRNVFDLFGAGTETTSSTIYWFVLYMINFPDIQEKVYSEIKEVVGTDRNPNMQDRSQLPFLNAVILETLRLGSIIPFSLIHMCSEDVTLRGYVIPKGASIIPNLDSILHDKTIWGKDVMTFKPERFIDASGKLQDREELVSFGIGRRACVGEAMAKMELFLFITNLIQRFQLLPKDKIAPPCDTYIFGLSCNPHPYEVRMVERK